VPHNHCVCCCLRLTSVQWHGLVKIVLGWLEQDYQCLQANQPKKSLLKIWQKTWPTFYKFHICFFLSALRGVTTGVKECPIPQALNHYGGAKSLWGRRIAWGEPKSPNNVTSTFNYKRLCNDFDTGWKDLRKTLSSALSVLRRMANDVVNPAWKMFKSPWWKKEKLVFWQNTRHLCHFIMIIFS